MAWDNVADGDRIYKRLKEAVFARQFCFWGNFSGPTTKRSSPPLHAVLATRCRFFQSTDRPLFEPGVPQYQRQTGIPIAAASREFLPCSTHLSLASLQGTLRDIRFSSASPTGLKAVIRSIEPLKTLEEETGL